MGAGMSAGGIVGEAASLGMSPGRLLATKFRKGLDARTPAESNSLPARTWRAIDPAVRTTLVMIALDTPGDVRALALQAWESFSHSDQSALASMARMFKAELRDAAALW